jgi:nitrilase
MPRIAALQLSSTPDVTRNLDIAEALLAEAADTNVDLALLPENFAHMPANESERLVIAEDPDNGPIQEFLAGCAKRYGIWVIGGSVPLRSDKANKVYAACMGYDPSGNLVARYDKVHLFDVTLDNGKHYAESDVIEYGGLGENISVMETPWGGFGLSICYDVRFPELYRRISCDDMVAIVVPAAFTSETGEAHWELLLRARAVENLAYVIGAGQYGVHPNGRSTWGHSMIVDPWGRVMSELSDGDGVVSAELDLQELVKLRERFPCLDHRRL